MGRPEKPLPRISNRALTALAAWLRDQRAAAGLTYTELAERTETAKYRFEASTFKRAASGQRIPRLVVVEAYAEACGASVKEAHRLWRSARHHVHRPPSSYPKPLLISSAVELRAALSALYCRAGSPPLLEVERRTGGSIPHSTLQRMLRGTGMLRREQMTPFLTFCEVPEKEHLDWLEALDRAWKSEFGLFTGPEARWLVREQQRNRLERMRAQARQRQLEEQRWRMARRRRPVSGERMFSMSEAIRRLKGPTGGRLTAPQPQPAN